MATYTAILSTQVDADSPLDTTLMVTVKDNDQYLFDQFDPSTGHRHTGSSQDGPVIVDGELVVSAADTYIIASAPTEQTTVSTSYVKLKEIAIGQLQGTLRIAWEHENTTSTVFTKVYRNGSPVGVEKSRAGVYQAASDDVAGWASNDLLQIYAKVIAGTGRIRNVEIKSDKAWSPYVTID